MSLLLLSVLPTIFILHEETEARRAGDLEVEGYKPGYLTPGPVPLTTIVSGKPILRHLEGEKKVGIERWGNSTPKIL